MDIWPKDKSFVHNIEQLFEYDESHSNIYDVVKMFLTQHNELTLNKLPKFFKIFLKDPYKFKDFLDVILDASLSSPAIVYKDVNILTLMCCAVFHLTKLYIMLNRVHTEYQHITKDAAEYYHLPFAKWIHNVIIHYNAENKEDFIIQTSKKHIFNSFQYLLLMSFVSKDLYIKDRPLFKYMEAINKLYHTYDGSSVTYPKFLDPIDDILKVLILDDSFNNKDLYHFHVKLQYVLANNRIETTSHEIINYRFIIEAFNEMNFDNILVNGVYNITNYTKYRFDAKQIFHKYYYSDNTYYKFPIFIIFELIFELNETYKVVSTPSRYYEVVIDTGWTVFCNKWYDFLVNSEDLETDFTYVVYSLGGHISYNHFFTFDDVFKRDETILFAIVRNVNFEQNAVFIEKVLRSVLLRDFSKFPRYMMRKMKGIADMSSNDCGLVYKKNENNEDILLILMERLFMKNILTRSIQYASSILKNKNILVKSGSFDNDQLKFVFKEIIHHLLSNSKNLKNNEYMTLLYQYEDALKQINIDLNSYNAKYLQLMSRRIVCCICICKSCD